ECNRLPDRRDDACGAHEQEHDPELEEAERCRDPARLVAQQPVVGLDVEREPDAGHESGRIHRPPAMLGGGEHARRDEDRQERREARLEPASQRVRHDTILRRNPCATYFAPASVSAAGNAHCAATPPSASVRVPSETAGTLPSGASTIQPSTVSRACSSARRASSGSCRNPCRKPVAQITCSVPFTDDSMRKRSSICAVARGSSHCLPGGKLGASSVLSRSARSPAESRWKAASP